MVTSEEGRSHTPGKHTLTLYLCAPSARDGLAPTYPALPREPEAWRESVGAPLTPAPTHEPYAGDGVLPDKGMDADSASSDQTVTEPDSPAPRLMTGPDARAEMLLHALHDSTRTTWRWAGASVAVERVSPYRVVVLSGPTWQLWRDWRDDINASDCALCVEVHTPLRVASDAA